MLRSRKGQSTFELTLTIVVVIAAVIAMSIYMKRSVMGKMREAGDQMGGQFSPLNTTNSYTRTFTGSQDENLGFTGTGSTNNINQTQDRTGNENVSTLSTDTVF